MKLIILLALPFTGALAVFLFYFLRDTWLRGVAIAISALTLLYAFSLHASFDQHSTAMQFYTEQPWNPQLGTFFAFGLDGISYPLVLLTTLLCFAAILVSHGITHHVRGYYSLMLLLEATTLGVFTAQDWSLFYIFWELVLIPLFFLIDRWGWRNRQTAALNFVLYTMGGSVFMLLSLLILFDHTGLQHSFLFKDFLEIGRHLSSTDQTLLLIGLVIGFGVKMPIFPLHGWLPLADVEAPDPVSILLSGILVKMGVYGLLRAAAILPEGMLNLQPVLLTLGIIAVIYGGLLAWRQEDLKRLIAYSSISHMGVIVIGIATLNLLSLQGAMLQVVAHGLLSGALFLLVGLLYLRTQTRNLHDYGSMIHSTPKLALLLIAAIVGSIGLPGTVGFIAEVHTLLGGYQRWQWLIVVLSFGMIITASYSLMVLRQFYTGPIKTDQPTLHDLRFHELVAAGSLIGMAVLLGFYPSPLIDLTQATLSHYITLFPNPVTPP